MSKALERHPSSPPQRILMGRDLKIAAWLERLGGASVEQIQRRFSMNRTVVYRRLESLKRHGLARRCHLLADKPPLYVRGGATVRSSHYAHTFRLTELVVDLELQGREIIGEVEIRRQRFGEPCLDDRLTLAQVELIAACPRIPDAVEVVDAGALIAYEVELSSKGRKRRERILSAYAASRYLAVKWIVPEPQLAALLTREIEAMGLSEYMEVSG